MIRDNNFSVRFSRQVYMAELYLDQLVDLLLPEEAAEEPPPLSVHVDSQGMVYVQNVTELAVADAAQSP